MKTIMGMLSVAISLIMIQAIDGFSYDEENILGENNMDPQQITHKCSNRKLYPNGCCRDFKTKPNLKKYKGYLKDEACALQLCYDFGADYCLENKHKCHKEERFNRRCPYTCGLCNPRANPKSDCEKKTKSPYGCCWNGVPATGPNNQGCLSCRNLRSTTLCRRMKYDETCESGRYGITKFLVTNCAKLCGLC